MKKNILLTSVIALITVFTFSCKNKEVPVYDIDFMFIEPTAAQVYSSGSEVHLEIDVQGTAPLNNLEVLVINLTANDTIQNYDVTTNDQFYEFHEHLIITVGVPSSFKVLANGWEGNYANRVSKEVLFTVNP